MSTTLTTSVLGGSNLRGTSRQTRHLPARTSRNARSTLGQNSLVSAAPTAQGAPQPEPHGFYPAITHFTDAITALPREFRRHASLLKEVDAKAWAVEESIQKLLKECLHERQTRPSTSSAQTVAGSTSSIAGDGPTASTAGSIAGNVLDTASQYSHPSTDPDLLRRRRLYAELRSHLMQMIMPLDEKNHVINNANEELSRHVRRQDEIWPHMADEISEETRLGSLRHWALTDLNPTKKTQAAAARGREILVADNEVAERSERRREAVALAKKQRSAQHADSDADLRKVSRKGMGSKKLQDMDDVAALNLIGHLPGVKVNKSRLAAHKKADDPARKLVSTVGDVAMSRESSQQDHSKKRKAPTPAMTAARKRLNTAAGDSPKLGQSPLASGSGKDVPKRSPALSAVRPVNPRGRQNSAQSSELSHRPSSSSRRNGVTATGSELERVATATGKTVNEVKQAMKDTLNGRAEKMLDKGLPDPVDNRSRGGIALERSASKSSQLKKDDVAVGRRTASPRLIAAAPLDAKSGKNGKGKASKTSTPTVGTFADADASESAAEATSTAENGSERIVKPKRPARPRMKDHHGLHDSLSPKGLPTKRTHKKNGSYSLSASFGARSNRDEEVPERKTVSRTNSRSAKTGDSREARNASDTPRIGGPPTELVDEPESLPSTTSEDVKPSSRRRPTNARPSTSLDVQPAGTSRTTAASNALRNATAASPALKSEMHDLGSPGPDIADDADADGDEDDEDPNEIRYCYCNGVSYGEMIACDNENCAREWFHLECTGLRSLPPVRSTWFCDECKATMVR